LRARPPHADPSIVTTQSTNFGTTATGIPAVPPRRAVSRRRRILVRLSGGTILLALGALLVLATIFPPLGARRAAREAASRELRAQLDTGEAVVAQVYVSQRNWTDDFRESFGILAATDRRLLYVAAPAVPLLPPEPGPPEMTAQSFGYDAAFALRPVSLFFGALRGMSLRTLSGGVPFIVGYGDWKQAEAVSAAVERAQVARRDASERERQANQPPPPAPPVYVSHTVRPGEALTSIARHYGTSADVIRQLNGLSGDAIRIGQRLRVPQAPGGATP
jgi:hypothetical protein